MALRTRVPFAFSNSSTPHFFFDYEPKVTTMEILMKQLINDEAGFIVSAELVLVATILVLSLIVGLGELALNLTSELEDVGSAIGNISQGYVLNGLSGHLGQTVGNIFEDAPNFCSDQGDIVSDIACDIVTP